MEEKLKELFVWISASGRAVEVEVVLRKKRAVRGGERTCREWLVERPCVKEKDTESVLERRLVKLRKAFEPWV